MNNTKISISSISTQPITYRDIKSHLRLDSDDEKDYIELLISAAVAAAEKHTESLMTSRTITLTSYSTQSRIYLPFGPVTSITSISDYSSNTITNYELEYDGTEAYVEINESFESPVTITYIAGYATLPADLKVAIMAHVGHLFNNRESVTAKTLDYVPLSTNSVYTQYRLGHFIT